MDALNRVYLMHLKETTVLICIVDEYVYLESFGVIANTIILQKMLMSLILYTAGTWISTSDVWGGASVSPASAKSKCG